MASSVSSSLPSDAPGAKRTATPVSMSSRELRAYVSQGWRPEPKRLWNPIGACRHPRKRVPHLLLHPPMPPLLAVPNPEKQNLIGLPPAGRFYKSIRAYVRWELSNRCPLCGAEQATSEHDVQDWGGHRVEHFPNCLLHAGNAPQGIVARPKSAEMAPLFNGHVNFVLRRHFELAVEKLRQHYRTRAGRHDQRTDRRARSEAGQTTQEHRYAARPHVLPRTSCMVPTSPGNLTRADRTLAQTSPATAVGLRPVPTSS